MVVKRCAWGQCDADSRYPDRYPGISFIPFPKPLRQLAKCLRWIRACSRPHTQLSVDTIRHWTYICSRHFVDGMPTEENPDPVSAVPSESDHTKKRKLPNRTGPPCKSSKRAAATYMRLELKGGVTEDSDDRLLAPNQSSHTSHAATPTPAMKDIVTPGASSVQIKQEPMLSVSPSDEGHDNGRGAHFHRDSDEDEPVSSAADQETTNLEAQIPNWTCQQCGCRQEVSSEEIQEIVAFSFRAHFVSSLRRRMFPLYRCPK